MDRRKDPHARARLAGYRYIIRYLTITLPLTLAASIIITIVAVTSKNITPLAVGGLIVVASHIPPILKMRKNTARELGARLYLKHTIALVAIPIFIYIFPVSEYTYYSSYGEGISIQPGEIQLLKLIEPLAGISALAINIAVLIDILRSIEETYLEVPKATKYIVGGALTLTVISAVQMALRLFNIYTPLILPLAGIYILYIILSHTIIHVKDL